MAVIEYVDTTIGAGANDGTSWANAWRTDPTALASALASCNAGGTIYIQSDCIHLFVGDTTLSSANGAAGTPVTITSVKNTNEPPVEGDFETMTVGGGNLDAKTNGAFDITLAGWDIWIGMEFIAGNDFKMGPATVDVKLINCKILVDDNILTNSAYYNVYWENVDVVQVTSGQFTLYGNFEWKGGSFSFGGGSVSTVLFNPSFGGYFRVFDVDIQDLDAGDYLVNDISRSWDVLIKRCKIPAACNYMNNGPAGAGCKVRFHSVDDGDLIHRFNEYYFEGNIADDVAVYRDNAATYDGTNPYSVKMISNANAKEWTRPLRFKLAEIWCSANPTLTVELNTDNVVLQNDEFWLEIEYPDEITGALGQIDRTSRPATILTAPANLTTSAVAWTEGFGTEKPQKVEVTITGGQAGIHTIWACLAKPSTTVYVCPKIGIGPIDVNFIVPGSGIVEAGFPGVVLPSVNDVEDGVFYGLGGIEFEGNLESPSENDVEDGVGYGSLGTEYEGNFEAPSENDVEDGVGYGSLGTEFEGNFEAPAENVVLDSVTYGANGTEFTGTLAVLVEDISVVVDSSLIASVTFKQREAKTVQFTVTDASGAAVDLSIATLTFAVKKNKSDSAYVIQKLDAVFGKGSAALGIVTVQLSATDTDLDQGEYVGELHIVFTAANIDKSADITVIIVQAVVS